MITINRIKPNMLVRYYSEYSSDFINCITRDIPDDPTGFIEVYDPISPTRLLGNADVKYLHKWNTPMDIAHKNVLDQKRIENDQRMGVT